LTTSNQSTHSLPRGFRKPCERAVLALALFVLPACYAQHKYAFKTFDEAKAKHMDSKGWLPTFTPSDATLIDIFTGDRPTEFYGAFLTKDLKAVRSACAEGRHVAPHLPTVVQWWSIERPGPGFDPHSKIETETYEIGLCRKDWVFSAIRKSDRVVFYWPAANYP
jgi:hypothetical protein